MTVKLLTEKYLELLSLKGGCTGSSERTLQNTTLLEITCRRSYIMCGQHQSKTERSTAFEKALKITSSKSVNPTASLNININYCEDILRVKPHTVTIPATIPI